MITVRAFIEENWDVIESMQGYSRLCSDLVYYENKITPTMANNVIMKNILANEYGTVTNVSLAKLCQAWLRGKVA